MKVDKATALRMDFAGNTYYFCSPGCLHAFEADPQQHTSSATRPSETHATQRR